jgi:hypothetical protein
MARILLEPMNTKAVSIISRMLVVAAIIASSAAIAGVGRRQSGTAIQVKAGFYRLKTAIDVASVKAIGSAQTKASPSILQVSKEEASRVTELVMKSGGTLSGSPSVKTLVDQEAKITMDSGDGANSLTVTPSTRGSDTITLRFKLAVTTVTGQQRITRSASGVARVQESKSLLIIQNPRAGQPGFLAVVEARRAH